MKEFREEQLSWWVGIGREEFYEIIKTHKFSRFKTGPSGESFKEVELTKSALAGHMRKQRIRLGFVVAAATDLPRTTFPRDRDRDKKLEPIPYYEWNDV